MTLDLGPLAAQIATQTGAPPGQVREALEKMTPDDRAVTAKTFGLTYTPNGRKRGRPRSPVLELGRKTFPHVSERTQARLANATRLLREAGASTEDFETLMTDCARANGSINVARFERLAYEVWWQHFVGDHIRQTQT